MHVKKGDKVIVTTGKEKGTTGQIVKMLPKKGLIVVEGINKVKKHQKARRNSRSGQIIDKTMPIHVSNVRKA